MGRILAVFHPDFHFTCDTIDSSDFSSFRGQIGLYFYSHHATCTLLLYLEYRKGPKFSDTRKLCCKIHKIQTKRPNHRTFCAKDANGIAHSEDPFQTAPLGAVWSGSALFAQAYLSENLGSLWNHTFSETCRKQPLKYRQKKKTGGSLMQVKSIAEWVFCNTFDQH